MNKLRAEKQEAVIRALVEGSSIRSVERMTNVHRDTIMRLGIKVGNTCQLVLDETMRGLPCKRIEVDEVWCYVGKKQRHVSQEDDPNQVAKRKGAANGKRQEDGPGRVRFSAHQERGPFRRR